MADPKDLVSARESRAKPTHTLRYSSAAMRKKIAEALEAIDLPAGTYAADVAAVRAEVVPFGVKLHVTLTMGNTK
jgi:hypothetical protein